MTGEDRCAEGATKPRTARAGEDGWEKVTACAMLRVVRAVCDRHREDGLKLRGNQRQKTKMITSACSGIV